MEIEVNIKDNDSEFGFGRARELAKYLASNFGDAMMLSWCDHEKGDWYPVAECCGDKSWEIYANKRGSNLRITVNKDYEFMFYLN